MIRVEKAVARFGGYKMLLGHRLSTFLPLLTLVASLVLAEDHEGSLHLTGGLRLHPSEPTWQDLHREINITDIVRILEEHEQDLTDLRITQGHTSEVITGKEIFRYRRDTTISINVLSKNKVAHIKKANKFYIV